MVMAAAAASVATRLRPHLLLQPAPRPQPQLRLCLLLPSPPLPAPAVAAASASAGEGSAEEAAEKSDKARKLQRRVLVGFAIGLGTGGVVLAGGWVFAAAMAVVGLAGAHEYFRLVRGTAIGGGAPSPRYVSRVCSAICALMPILTL